MISGASVMFRLLLLPVIVTSKIFSSFLDDEAPICPEGFKYCDNAAKCLMIVNQPSAYFTAQFFCNHYNSSLTTIQDDFANNAICFNCNYCSERDYWIGATNYIYCDTPLCWLDPNLPFHYNRLSSDNYLKLNDTICVSYKNDYNHNWNIEDCDKKLPFICGTDPLPTQQIKGADQIPCVSEPVVVPSVPFCQPPPLSNYNPPEPTEQAVVPLCPDGWMFFSKTSSCYALFFNATYSDAEENCQANRAHLASIHSIEENKYIADLSKTGIAQYQNGQVWIGLKRVPKGKGENEFETLDGSEYDFQNWADGQPDNYEGNENCVELYADPVPYYPDTAYGWNDCPCDDPMRAYVCKKKVDTSNIFFL